MPIPGAHRRFAVAGTPLARSVDVRETLVAVPRKKRAVADEEQAHRTRSHGQVEKASSRSATTSVIHRSIEHRGRLPSQAHARSDVTNERWPMRPARARSLVQ